MSYFDSILSVSTEDIDFEFRGFEAVPWSPFILNPRRLRGSDFLMRWSQGVWSERRLIEAINNTSEFYAIPYGPSSTAPQDDVRAFELYFERLESAGVDQIKRPDLLIYKSNDRVTVDSFIDEIGGADELPFLKEDDIGLLIELSIIAVECENSLWVAAKMPSFNEELRPMKRLNGKLGLPKNAILPTVIIKEEDRKPLFNWQSTAHTPIHIWHVFFDRAYGLALDMAQELLDSGLILPTNQTFQAPGGATSSKYIYKYYYHYAYNLAESLRRPELISNFIEDSNGHILPYVTFSGGELKISKDTILLLRELSNG